MSQLISQKDDKNRNALHSVIKKSENLPGAGEVSTFQDLINYFAIRKEFFKARVLTELIWEYEDKINKQFMKLVKE